MAEIDVHDLARESLASVPFPIVRTEAFRVHIAERVHQGTWKHASADTSHEICGVLVGSWAKDVDGPFAQITEFIRCDNAAQKFAEVTFTHESWAQINGEMDSKYRDLRIIGWYHSHPNFGIFLSDRDCFIQEHFFSGPGQIALVIDPIRKIEGIFEWRRGKPVPIHHYWVGDSIHLGVNQPPSPDGSPVAGAEASQNAAAQGARDDSPFSPVLVTLIAVLMLLLGYMYGGQRGAWESQRLAEGAVAHYGIWKLYKPGFEEYLADAIAAQVQITADLKRLAEELPKATDETRDDLKKQWQERQADMAMTIERLKFILEKYGLDRTERETMLALMRDKLAVMGDLGGDGKSTSKPLKSAAETKDRKEKATESSKQTKPDKAVPRKAEPERKQ